MYANPARIMTDTYSRCNSFKFYISSDDGPSGSGFQKLMTQHYVIGYLLQVPLGEQVKLRESASRLRRHKTSYAVTSVFVFVYMDKDERSPYALRVRSSSEAHQVVGM